MDNSLLASSSLQGGEGDTSSNSRQAESDNTPPSSSIPSLPSDSTSPSNQQVAGEKLNQTGQSNRSTAVILEGEEGQAEGVAVGGSLDDVVREQPHASDDAKLENEAVVSSLEGFSSSNTGEKKEGNATMPSVEEKRLSVTGGRGQEPVKEAERVGTMGDNGILSETAEERHHEAERDRTRSEEEELRTDTAGQTEDLMKIEPSETVTDQTHSQALSNEVRKEDEKGQSSSSDPSPLTLQPETMSTSTVAKECAVTQTVGSQLQALLTGLQEEKEDSYPQVKSDMAGNYTDILCYKKYSPGLGARVCPLCDGSGNGAGSLPGRTGGRN